MTYLVLVVVAVAAVELFMRLPVGPPLQALQRLSRKIPGVLGSRHISDHWKEKVLQRYARDLALNSIRIFAWLLVAMVLIVLFISALDMLLAPPEPTLEYLAGAEGIILVTLLSLVYFWLRRRFVSG